MIETTDETTELQALRAEVAALRNLTVSGITALTRTLGDLEGKLFNFDGAFDAINRRLDKLARDADPPVDTK